MLFQCELPLLELTPARCVGRCVGATAGPQLWPCTGGYQWHVHLVHCGQLAAFEVAEPVHTGVVRVLCCVCNPPILVALEMRLG